MKVLLAHHRARDGTLTTCRYVQHVSFRIDKAGKVWRRFAPTDWRLIGVIPDNAIGRVVKHRDGTRTTYQWVDEYATTT